MASAMASIELAAEPDAVWGLIGGFGSLPDWRPYITFSQLGDGGRTRTLRNPDGDTIVERLIAYGDAARQYTHAIAQAPFPVIDHRSTLQVLPYGDGTRARVLWSGTFTESGVTHAEAAVIFQKTYDDGLKALWAHYQPRGT